MRRPKTRIARVPPMTHSLVMRTALMTFLAVLVTVISSVAQVNDSDMLRHANPNPYPWNPDAATRPLRFNPNFHDLPSTVNSLPKGAIHLMVRSDTDARQIFTYFISPSIAARPGAVGIYRVEVNPQGSVAAVTILKSMGHIRDIHILKTLVTWRAKPGSLRVVDLSLVMS